jgi:transposase
VRLEVVKRSDDVDGFHVLPRRWVVERTFGWLTRCRRLWRDYEPSTAHAEKPHQDRNDPADGRHRAGHQTRYRNIRPAVA